MLLWIVGGNKIKGYMTYQPEDPLKKAELMAEEMRRSKRRSLIASKRALHNPLTTEEQPKCFTCYELRDANKLLLNHSELHVKQAHSMP